MSSLFARGGAYRPAKVGDTRHALAALGHTSRTSENGHQINDSRWDVSIVRTVHVYTVQSSIVDT
jgi:hypothetical protein